MAPKFDPSKLTTGLKRELVKDADRVSPDLVEATVRNIHAASEKKKDSNSKATKRMTMDFDKTLHKKVMWHVLENEITLKDYVTNLIKKDLGVE